MSLVIARLSFILSLVLQYYFSYEGYVATCWQVKVGNPLRTFGSQKVLTLKDGQENKLSA